MTETPKCNQKTCENEAAYRFTWPGKDEAVICETHVGTLRDVAKGIGLHLEIIPLKGER